MKKLGFGFMRLPQTDADDWKSIDIPLLKQMVDAFIKKGFTYFDTAYMYHLGVSEDALKQTVVERFPRSSFTVADKSPVWLVERHGDFQKYFDEQCTRLGVDYIDYYMLHALNELTYLSTEKYDGFDFMKRIKAEGKAKHIGLSYHDNAEVLDRILTAHPETDFVQLQINYADWDSESIESRKCYEVAVRHKTPVIVMEPIKGGSLANPPKDVLELFKKHSPNASAASWAIRYAASLDNVFMVLSGMSTPLQLADNIGYMEAFKPLDNEERAIVVKAAKIITENTAIPCTACQYCVENCPQNIPIPKYFSLFNDRKRFENANPIYYSTLTQTFGKASDCIACGQCQKHCPQHIDIIECMKEVSRVFDVPSAF
ncbi:MAG: aldo/keto reductase [Clostridiales bacterium]|nr:aldo/keto reductase [Clostridiales bacterium]